MKKSGLKEAFKQFQVSSKEIKGGYRVYGPNYCDVNGDTFSRYTEYDDWNCETGSGVQPWGCDSHQ